MLEAIRNGISKINIGTSVRQAYESSLRSRPNDVLTAQKQVAREIERLIKEYEVEGSWDLLGKYITINSGH